MEVEEALHQLGAVAVQLALGVVEEARRGVEELVGEALAEGFEHLVGVFALGEQAAGALELGAAQGVGVLTEARMVGTVPRLSSQCRKPSTRSSMMFSASITACWRDSSPESTTLARSSTV